MRSAQFITADVRIAENREPSVVKHLAFSLLNLQTFFIRDFIVQFLWRI